jgi:hypothetical protein
LTPPRIVTIFEGYWHGLFETRTSDLICRSKCGLARYK